jgi:hypothetical protein
MLAAADHRFTLSNLGRYTDVLRLRGGKTLTVRFVEQRDAVALLTYFRSLSQRSRYSRLMGAASELPPSELDKALHNGEGNRFAVIAEMKVDGADTLVGEARYSFDAATQDSEFGLSIGDAWQGTGHRTRDAGKSRMPLGGAGRCAAVRRNAAQQRADDRSCPQVGLCLLVPAERLAGDPLREAPASRDRYSVRKLEAGGDGGLAVEGSIAGCALITPQASRLCAIGWIE